MEGQVSKRRRIYSLEPNKVAQAVFARKYVNHLVPALMEIKQKISPDHENGDHELEKIVRYEVDKALVLSAERFAWSHALKDKLQRNVNVGRCHNSSNDHHLDSLKCPTSCSLNHSYIVENEVGNNLPWPHVQNASLPITFPPHPNQKCKVKKLMRRAKKVVKKEDVKESEEEQISSKLMNLKTLLPGGSEMGVDELLGEVGSYITCLELQVNILSCLVDRN